VFVTSEIEVSCDRDALGLYGLASKVCEPTDESQSDDDPPITEALCRRWLRVLPRRVALPMDFSRGNDGQKPFFGADRGLRPLQRQRDRWPRLSMTVVTAASAKCE
jgi:hypothetical protein